MLIEKAFSKDKSGKSGSQVRNSIDPKAAIKKAAAAGKEDGSLVVRK
jgi:hypothetical protein